MTQPRLTWDRTEEPAPPPVSWEVRSSHGASLAATVWPTPNRLFFGDNLAVMRHLRAELEGRIQLIYLDPPFASQADYVHSGGGRQELAFSDRWPGGLGQYLDMLWPRLVLMRELLSAEGSLYIHLDPTASHYVKVLLDEIFGPECFQREIIWRIGWISGYKSSVKNWVRNHDVILFYTRDPQRFTFHRVLVPHPPGYERRGGGEGAGRPVEDVWNASPAEHALHGAESLNSIQIVSFSGEKTGYRTQKNESLLRRIVAASSSPGDLVADFFCGSGTTMAACEALGRRWVAADQGAAALAVSTKRLLELPVRAPFDVWAPAGQAEPPEAGNSQTPA